jgi:hypothetical protein
MEQILIGAFVTLAIGGVTAFITTTLNLRRYRSEKWWEKKSEAYAKIIQALHHATNTLLEWAEQDMIGDDVPEEKAKRLDEDYKNARLEIETATGIGAYIISKEVADVLVQLKRRKRPARTRDTPRFELYEADAEAYGSALDKIRELARKDLKV